MKFLVLALCVCAASAATISPFSRQQQPARFQPFPENVAQAAVEVSEPVNTAYAAAQVVAEAPVAAARAAYGAAKQAYAATKDSEAVIVRSDSVVEPDSYNYFYETNNGISGQANGITKKVGEENVLAVQGSYKYIDPSGTEIVVNYVADENGFQPQSNILPVGPAIPEAILRSLEYIRTHAPATDKY